jgi:O-methyltransferase
MADLSRGLRASLLEVRSIVHESGQCWVTNLSEAVPAGDSNDASNVSTLRLFEDEHELGPAHAIHDEIRRKGGGRFSHWGRALYFSTSDGSSPLANGRRYRALLEAPAADMRARILAAAAQIDPAGLTPEQRYAWGERLFALFAPEAKLAEFGRSFYRDAEFLTDYERFDRENYRSLDRKFALKELLKLALPLDGEVAECGVFRGASAYLIAKRLVAARCGKTLHLFDSFAGLSRPGASDGDYWQAGALACSLAEVRANLATVAETVRFHAGWIPERFGDVAEKRFCFVQIDVDLHQPTWDALTFFYPRLVPGGILICDDYGFETCPGARKAMDTFFADKPEPVIHLPTGQGFVIRQAR